MPQANSGPVAAEGEERELARIAAPLGRHRLDGADHVGGGDLVRAVGGVLDGRSSGSAIPAANARAGLRRR